MRSGNANQAWLRCTAFEELMLSQDCWHYPCAVCVRLVLSQRIEKDKLQTALGGLLERHPLLRARLVGRRFKLWWQLLADAQPQVNWHLVAAPTWPALARLDLEQEVGIVVDVYHQPDSSAAGCVLFMQVHHALVDGLGCLTLVEDLLGLLGGQAQDAPADQGKLLDQLAQRNRFGLNLPSLLRLLPGQLVGLAGVRQFLMRQPTLIGSRQPLSAPIEPPQPGVISVCAIELEPDQAERLKQLAREQAVTVNDLLATAVFETIDQFQREHQGSDEQWLRMMVPMSLRDPQAPPLPACNVVSCVFLDRTGRQIADRQQLLRSVHQEMALIKRHRLAFMFIFSLWIKQLLTLRLGSAAGRRRQPPARCQTSFVFSNMARIFSQSPLRTASGHLSQGDLRLESCQVLAPVAAMMRMAITAVQYAGRLTLALRYDSQFITGNQAEAVMASLRERLQPAQVPELAGEAKKDN